MNKNEKLGPFQCRDRKIFCLFLIFSSQHSTRSRFFHSDSFFKRPKIGLLATFLVNFVNENGNGDLQFSNDHLKSVIKSLSVLARPQSGFVETIQLPATKSMKSVIKSLLVLVRQSLILWQEYNLLRPNPKSHNVMADYVQASIANRGQPRPNEISQIYALIANFLVLMANHSEHSFI